MTARSREEIAAWCVDYLARLLERPAQDIAIEAPFARVGLDSAMALYFTIDLEKWLGSNPDQYMKETLWVYGNSIYVGMDYGAQ